MRIAAAAARELLRTAAARRLKTKEESLIAKDGYITDRLTDRRLSYGELAEDAAQIPVPQDPQLKDPKKYRHVGTSRARVDIPDKIFGMPIYGMDRAVEGMHHVAVVGTQTIFAEVEQITNKDEILARRGVRRTLVRQPLDELELFRSFLLD